MSEVMSCPHCNGEMSVTPDLYGQIVRCPHCNGEMSIPAPQTAPTTGTLSSRYISKDVPNYLVYSILVTLFCCVPFGIAAIVMSVQANSKKAAGDYVGARRAASSAKSWCIAAFVCGLIAAVFVFILRLQMLGFR